MKEFDQAHKAGLPTEGMKVEKMCELAIAACEKRGRKEKTLKGYRDFLKNHIATTIGSVKISELQAAHAERLMDKMKDKDTGAQTQLLCRNFLRMAINRVAIKGGFVATNAAALADPPKVLKVSRNAMTPQNLGALLAAEDNPMLRAMWLLLASTGLRPVEARGLLWSDFYEREDGWWIQLRESKTDEGMKPVPISAVVWEELKKVPKTSMSPFATKNGRPIDESNLRRAWVELHARAEVPYTNLYQLASCSAPCRPVECRMQC